MGNANYCAAIHSATARSYPPNFQHLVHVTGSPDVGDLSYIVLNVISLVVFQQDLSSAFSGHHRGFASDRSFFPGSPGSTCPDGTGGAVPFEP